MRPTFRPLVSLLTASALTACSLAPKYVRPELPVPPSWPVGDAYLRQSEAPLPSVTYRDIFRDARLQRIIDQALVNNRDLRVAVANIEATRAQYRIQRADLFPQLDATGSYSYRRTGSSGVTTGVPIGTGGNAGGGGTGVGNGGTGVGNGGTGVGNGGTGNGGVGGGTGGTSNFSNNRSTFSAQLGVTAFEIDLFGRVRSLTSAALNRYFGQEAAARATRLTLVSDIANAWVTYGSDASLLKIAQDTATSAQRSVQLTRARLAGGVSPRSDVRQAEQVLETAQADLAQQRSLLAQDVNALQLLVGAPVDGSLLPASIDDAAKNLGELPAGLDSGILLRRPDVVQAEYSLRAANAEIGAARAQLFPRVALTAVVGFASTALRTLFTGGAFNYSVAPNVSYPIFRAGAGRAGVDYSKAQRDAALATYEGTIQTAFREVSDALARRGTITDQLAANQRFLNAAADTLQLANARYQGGIDTYLTSLDAQRSLYTAQRTVVQTQLTRASNLVTLYQTLGGDSQLEATAQGPMLPGSTPTQPRP
ncbi:outer membrane protein, multidrug efflux system [Sphingomonas palmae]|uniref:Outer membrane protein, multidrug efflux system n=1 Tax=Sphingomonas palmae TaxID=1855283 RepID=A0A1H7HX89_9SPHN|nr:efflux transporter outer membrane subunit [Sphingomonas palmae]SEK54916.1 outer membrane protein, multidrug efflux system [Sphingomonas palmae]